MEDKLLKAYKEHLETIARVYYCWTRMPGYFQSELADKRYTLNLLVKDLEERKQDGSKTE